MKLPDEFELIELENPHTIPDDDVLDRAMQPSRRTPPKPSVIVQRKKTGKTVPHKKHKR